MLAEPPRIAPMLAATGALPAGLPGWAAEVKWDGQRCIATIDADGRLALASRGGHDITSRYPELADLPELVGRPAVLDGEIVVPGPDGRPDFWRLLSRAQTSNPAAARRAARTRPATLMLFDLPWIDGELLARAPWTERRARLEALLPPGPTGAVVRVPPAWIGSGAVEAALTFTAAHRLEGCVAKRMTSTYEAGRRSRNWIKHRFDWPGGHAPAADPETMRPTTREPSE